METTEETFDEKVMALAKHLEIEADEAQDLIDREDYMVLTDEEADEKAEENILDSVWAFRAGFLSYYTDLDEDVIRIIQEKMCESCNEQFKRLIHDKDQFVKEAIMSDGRGHFMNSYDGHEYEVKNGDNYFYIYRMN